LLGACVFAVGVLSLIFAWNLINHIASGFWDCDVAGSRFLLRTCLSFDLLGS
jgi:hypothetical protein